MVASFALFSTAALVLLAYPQGRPFGVAQHASHLPAAHGNLFLGPAALLICAASLFAIGRLALVSSHDPRTVLVNCLLVLFLLFFALERLIGYAGLWPPLHWLASWPVLAQLLSSVAVAIGAAILFPRLRSRMEGPALARKEHDRFLAAAESSLDDFYIFDGIPDSTGAIVDFRFAYINPNAERRLNIRREDLLGKVLTEVRPFMISSGLIENYRELVRTGVPFTCEVFIDDHMIKATWINVQAVKLGDGIAITSRDVTERKRLTDRVSYLAHHDHLTGLPNRSLLDDRLRQAMLHAQRRHEKVGVFMLDIDYFKRINDSLGHSDGDALLAAIAKRLLSSVRETDTIIRMGGDEFVIVMPEFKSVEDVSRCGLQIVERAAEPISIGGREISITVSVGLCIYPDHGLEADQLLKNADTAMYAVKETGRNGLHIFTGQMAEAGL